MELTTKELKKQSTGPMRPVGGRRAARRTERTHGKAAYHVVGDG